MDPVVVRLTYAQIYGFNFELDPGAPLPAPGSDPKTWGNYPVATVVRLAPYNPTDATEDQRFEHECWVDNDPANDPNPDYRTDDPSPDYYFCATYTAEFGYRVEVLPDFLCGL